MQANVEARSLNARCPHAYVRVCPPSLSDLAYDSYDMSVPNLSPSYDGMIIRLLENCKPICLICR